MEYCADNEVLQNFKDEESHTRIDISHGIRVIKEAAFKDCGNFTGISVHEFFTKIDPCAFRIHEDRDAFLSGGPFLR